MANNLGTLTLDLVAKIGGFTGPLDKAARESQKKMADIRKSADIAGKAIAGLAVATASGLAVLTVNTVRAANEVSRLAQVSNSSTEEFQRYAAGAQAVGIEQDKLGDIFKDVNDKVGDFLQTGGGALADFFEKVAPKVGVTAEQFRKLSGPEALGLYVSSLEKAGASQQDMTFYLEAIASDATALLPLLQNNAEGFRLLGESAAQAGAILDNDTIRAATELQAVSILTGQAMDGLRNQIAAGLLPVLSGLAEEFYGAAQGGANFKDVGEFVGETLKFIASAAVGAYTSFQLVGKGIAGLAYIASQIPDGLDAVKQAVGEVGDELDSTAQSAANAIDRINSAGEGGARGGMVSRLADLLEQTSKRGKSAGIVIDQTAEKTKKATDAIQSQIEALQLQAATLGMTTREQTQLDQAAAAFKTIEAYEAKTEALKKAADEQARINQEAIGIADSLASEEEQILKSYERRRQIILDNTQVTGEAQAELLRKLEEQKNEDLLDINGSYWERYLEAAGESLTSFDELAGSTIENFSTRFGSAFEAMIFDAQTLEESVVQMAEGMARSVVNALGQMAAQWLAYQVVQLLVGKTTQASAATTIAANASAMSITAGINAFASAAAIPIVGWAAAPGAMAAALAVTGPMAVAAGSLALAGMAHDGIDSVPQTGTWLLEKGERVTTAGTSAKLDATLSRIQAGMSDQGGRSGSRGNVTVNQNNTFGSPDNRTANQAARAIVRQQRVASARLG